MNIYFTVEEKYLQAIRKVNYGRTPKALRLLKEILDNDPLHGRTHYQLGKLYYYQLDDYQTAGFHFKTCMELEPSFPDNYFDYLCLAVFLNMEKLVAKIAGKALTTAGVDSFDIHNQVGLFFEKNKKWPNAIDAYEKAFIDATCKDDADEIEESIKRVHLKMERAHAYQYQSTA